MPGDGVDFVGTAFSRLRQFFGGRQQLFSIGVRVLNINSIQVNSIQKYLLIQLQKSFINLIILTLDHLNVDQCDPIPDNLTHFDRKNQNFDLQNPKN